MPIAGLVCSQCWTATETDGTHWLDGDCTTLHPGIIQAALDAESHNELVLTPTTVLGKVREQVIRRALPCYPEAQGFNAMVVGAAMGRTVEESMARKGWLTQEKVTGELWGEPFVGVIDLAAPDWSQLWDNKFKSEGSFFWQRGRGSLASDEDAAQLNMYRMLAAQSGHPEAADAEMWVWYGANLAARDRKKELQDSWMKCRARVMDEAEIGAMKPYGSALTVAEHVEILARAFKRLAAGEDVEAILADVPPACEGVFNGQGCGTYCSSARQCLPRIGKTLREKGIVSVVLPDGGGM